MDFDDIENQYNKIIEDSEKRFIEGIKNKQDIKKLEITYKNDLKRARELYNALVLKRLKSGENKKQRTEVKEDKIPPLNIQKTNYELSSYQKRKLKLDLLIFKLRFHSRNYIRSHTPEFISHIIIVCKIKLKRIKQRMIMIFDKISSTIKIILIEFFEMIKETTKKTYEKLTELPIKIIEKLTKKKKLN